MSGILAGQSREHDHQGGAEGGISLHFREWGQQRRRDIFTKRGFTWKITQVSLVLPRRVRMKNLSLTVAKRRQHALYCTFEYLRTSLCIGSSPCGRR